VNYAIAHDKFIMMQFDLLFRYFSAPEKLWSNVHDVVQHLPIRQYIVSNIMWNTSPQELYKTAMLI